MRPKASLLLPTSILLAAGIVGGVELTGRDHATATTSPPPSSTALKAAAAQRLVGTGAGDEPTTQQLGQFVKSLAAANGDGDVTKAVYVQLPRSAAEIAMGDGHSADAADTIVDLAVVDGNFTLYSAPRASLGPVPTGTKMEVAISVNTGQVLDFGIDDGSPTLTQALASAQDLSLS